MLASRGGRSAGLRVRDDAPDGYRGRGGPACQPARWGGTGVGSGGASVTVTRTRAGALPSADSGPLVGEIVSRSRRYSPGESGAVTSSATATEPPGPAIVASSSVLAAAGTGAEVVETQVAGQDRREAGRVVAARRVVAALAAGRA